MMITFRFIDYSRISAPLPRHLMIKITEKEDTRAKLFGYLIRHVVHGYVWHITIYQKYSRRGNARRRVFPRAIRCHTEFAGNFKRGMKMKRLIVALLVAALCMVAPAVAFGWDELPTEKTVKVISVNPTSNAFFDIHIGQDIYPTWCVDAKKDVNTGSYTAKLSTTIGAGEKWNKINWVLNNKGDATYKEVQAAIWTILGQTIRWDQRSWYTPVAKKLVMDAKCHGDFIPECGQIGAVLVKPKRGCGQDTIFELATPVCIPDPTPTPTPVPEFPTMMIPVFLVGSLMVAGSILKKE